MSDCPVCMVSLLPVEPGVPFGVCPQCSLLCRTGEVSAEDAAQLVGEVPTTADEVARICQVFEDRRDVRA